MEEQTKLDRALQLFTLKKLAELEPYGTHDLADEATPGEVDNDVLMTNLLYLEEHGLITLGFTRSGSLGGDDSFVEVRATRITAKGQDFLLDDGGLSAILGVVTIKLHDDTLKSLVEAKILQSDLPQPDKKRWTDQLRELPAETTKHLVLKLVDLGLANAPAALGAIGSALGLGAAG